MTHLISHGLSKFSTIVRAFAGTYFYLVETGEGSTDMSLDGKLAV